MDTKHIISIADIESFLQGNEKIRFVLPSKKEKYQFILDTLVKLRYRVSRKKEKTLIKRYLKKVTGYSDQQIKRLIKLGIEGKLLSSLALAQSKRRNFPRIYGPKEIALLAQADQALSYPNGKSLKEHLVREFKEFKNKEYEIISKISSSHIYNLRNNSLQYQSTAMRYTKTNHISTPIGQRRKPDNMVKPGFLRVDSVHQGDLDKEKGVYHVNVVDEVTQWEVVGCVEGISERFLLPLIEDLFLQIPFDIINFHSDNGSEYINYKIAKLLNKLRIEQTKSRSRKTNDQALVESKNGSVIRKHIGRNHIPKKFAKPINDFYSNHFNTFLNYHRVCSFATDYIDKRGKIKKKYDIHLTPYDKLKSIYNAKEYLKQNISFEVLDEIAYAKSDIKFAREMNKEKSKVFKNIKIN